MFKQKSTDLSTEQFDTHANQIGKSETGARMMISETLETTSQDMKQPEKVTCRDKDEEESKDGPKQKKNEPERKQSS